MTFRQLGLTAFAVVAVPAALSAQAGRPGSLGNRAPEKDAAHVMITSFKTSEKAPAGTDREKILSFQAAEEMRKKVDGAFPYKQLYVIPVERIDPNLEASNFSTTEGLDLHDAKQLAVISRADEFIAGTASKTATGYRVEADLVLTRDINAKQPLGVGEAPKLGDAINVLVKEYKEARKALDGEKKCFNAAREQKWAEATQFANAAIAAYPKSTLARACLLSVLYTSKAPTAEITKVARELGTLDPRSNTALQYIADAYDKGGPSMSDSLVLTLVQMMRNDPRNAELQYNSVQRIAAATNPGLARPIVDSAIVQNPGDSDLLKLRWQILYAMKDYKEMFKQGDELARLDTAFADSAYFVRTADAYRADSNWTQAAATLSQGTKKFPDNAFMIGLEVQMLSRDAQYAPALEKINKAIAAKIPVPNAGTIKLQLLQSMKAPSADIVGAAKELIAAGDTTSNVRQIVLNEIQQLVVASSGALVQSDAAAAIDSLNVAITALKEAETTLAKTPLQKAQVSYLMGASNLTIGNIKSRQAAATKNCQLAKDARANVTAALTYLPGGAPFAQDAVNQSFQQATQIDSFLGQVMASLPNCK